MQLPFKGNQSRFSSYEGHFEFLAVFTNYEIFMYFSHDFFAEPLKVFCAVLVGKCYIRGGGSLNIQV